jgi:putative ABC transport system permease protein
MRHLHDAGQDVRLGLRQLTRRPGIPVLIILLLALGIGVNTAIFSVVKAVLLEPLPFKAPQELMQIWGTDSRYSRLPVSGPNFLDWREQARTFDRLVAYSPYYANLTGTGNPERLQATATTSGLFELLRVPPALGRTFRPEEEQSGKGDVAVISDGLWRRRFGADPGLLGRAFTLNGESRTVIGIMPPGFRHPCPWSFDSPTEVWTPLSLDDLRERREGNWLLALGRLADGVGKETAQEEMGVISERLEETYPDTNERVGARVAPVLGELLGRTTGQLLFLLAAAGLVLLIGLANVGGLLVARALTRRTEVAIRSSLGATRSRLVRQLVAENLPLFLIGGGLSVALASWGVDVLKASIPAGVPRVHEIEVDLGVLGFALGVSLLSALVVGLIPAVATSKTDLVEALKQGQGTIRGGRSRTRRLLVVSQFALTLVLANGAALMLQSHWELRTMDHGFRGEDTLTLRLNLQGPKYEEASGVRAFYRDVLERVEAIPGVRRAGAISRLPLDGGTNGTATIEGREDEFGDHKGPLVEVKVITPGYFDAIGIPLLSGRGLAEGDGSAERIGVVVNRTMARVAWPGDDPLGKRFRYGDSPWFTVVGVAGDTRQWGLEREPLAEAYFPYSEALASGFFSFRRVRYLVARTEVEPTSVVPAIRREIGIVDPDLPISDIRTTEALVAESLSGRRFNTILIGLFAGLGVVLVAAGMLGVMSFFVNQRVHEIGVRLALGANRSRVLLMVLTQGMAMAAIGLALGLFGVLATRRLTESMVYGVSPTDLVTLLGGVAFLLAVGVLASVFPARRATRVDPVQALRQE